MSKTKTIKQSYEMKATPSQVFKALTDARIIAKWSGAPAKMSARKGAKFELWGGDMFGKNLEVVKDKKLVQEWCTHTFSSKATFTIKAKGKNSIVDLLHENVPAQSYKNYSDGWKHYYLGPMQQMFEENE
ncbi:MAG TPA: SRPBCC domain-containing protein [Bacteroidia bacterium]|jgi:activator of HSP90 ATPase